MMSIALSYIILYQFPHKRINTAH